MKSKFIVASAFAMLCSIQHSFCQITSYVPTEVKQQTEEILPIPYDSLTVMSKYVLEDDMKDDIRRAKGYIGEVMYYDKPTLFTVNKVIRIPFSEVTSLNLKVVDQYNTSLEMPLIDYAPEAIVYTNIYKYNPECVSSVDSYGYSELNFHSGANALNNYYTILDVLYPNTEEYAKYQKSLEYDKDGVKNYYDIHYKRVDTDKRYSNKNKPFIVDHIDNGSHKYLLKLVNNATQDTVYTDAVGISVGYFEKIKSLHLNKKFLVRSEVKVIKDYVTNKNIAVQPMQEFTCSEISLYNNEIIAVFEAPNIHLTLPVGKKIIKEYCEYEDRLVWSTLDAMEDIAKRMQASSIPKEPIAFVSENVSGKFIHQEYNNNIHNYAKHIREIVAIEQKKEQAQKDAEWNALKAKVAQEELNHKNSCIAKYGEQFGASVAERKVMIGMSEQMVRGAWGNPFKIQQTNTVQTFIYYNSYRGEYSYVKIKDDKVVEVYQ